MFKNKVFKLYKKLSMPLNEVSAEFSMILDYLKINPLKELKEGFSEEEEKRILKVVSQRVETGMPLQYILGFGYFMGARYFVNESTLIPRPETEILVKECVKLVNKKSKILDIGTGSGCIAIEISKNTRAKVDGVDISIDALKIAKKNAKYHNVKCNFFYSDLFSNIKDKYDLIVSNPPYIPIKELNSLENHVKNFEPHAALFANDESGIEFYKKIIDKSLTFLNKNGNLCFEIGINQVDNIIDILSSKGFSIVDIIKDFDNIDRVIIAKFC